MSLINKDKLHYKRVWIKHEYDMKSDVVVFAKDIDKQPVIEAIPINWIQQYLNKQDEIDNLPVQVELFMGRMIDKWRKENEHNRLE